MISEFLVQYLVGTAAVVTAGLLALKSASVSGVFRKYRVPQLLLASTISLFVIQIFKSHALRNYADIAIWLQLLNNISDSGTVYSGLQEAIIPGTGHWFASHFTPLMVVFAPILKFFGPMGLIAAQFVTLQLSVLLVFLLAKKRLSDSVAATFVAAAFAINPTFQYIHLYEFEMLRFSIPILIGCCLLLDHDRLGAASLAALFALLVREDVAFVVFGLGAVLMFRKERRLLGLGWMLASVFYFLLVTTVIMPAYRTAGIGHIASFWFASLGETPFEVLKTMLFHPLQALQILVTPLKVANVFMLLLPFGILVPLFSPFALAAVLPLALLALSASPTHLSYFLYYVSPALALISVASVYGLETLSRLKVSELVKSLDARRLAASILSVAIAAQFFFGPSPLSLQFWLKSYRLAPFRTQSFHVSYFRPEHSRVEIARALAALPEGASVSAEQSLLPLLYKRSGLNIFPDLRNSDCAFIDRSNPIKTGTATVPDSWDGLRRNPEKYFSLLSASNGQWRHLHSEGGLEIYCRRTGSHSSEGGA